MLVLIFRINHLVDFCPLYVIENTIKHKRIFFFYSLMVKHLINICVYSQHQSFGVLNLSFSMWWTNQRLESFGVLLALFYCCYLITSKSRHQFTSWVLIAFESSMQRTIDGVTLQNTSRKYRFFLILMN